MYKIKKIDDYVEKNNIENAQKLLLQMNSIDALRYILLRDNVNLLEYLLIFSEKDLFKDLDMIKHLCKEVYFSEKCLNLLNNLNNRPDLKI